MVYLHCGPKDDISYLGRPEESAVLAAMGSARHSGVSRRLDAVVAHAISAPCLVHAKTDDRVQLVLRAVADLIYAERLTAMVL